MEGLNIFSLISSPFFVYPKPWPSLCNLCSKALIVPKKFAHGYSSLSKENIVVYFLSEDWHPKQESGIIWNDKFLNINWGVKKPILSKKDARLKEFSEL